MAITVSTPDGRRLRVQASDRRWVVLCSDGGAGIAGSVGEAVTEALELSAPDTSPWLPETVRLIETELLP